MPPFHLPSLSPFLSPAAYKHADGKKIDGRRVLVDVERGRTVKGWHPRRLGQFFFFFLFFFLLFSSWMLSKVQFHYKLTIRPLIKNEGFSRSLRNDVLKYVSAFILGGIFRGSIMPMLSFVKVLIVIISNQSMLLSLFTFDFCVWF